MYFGYIISNSNVIMSDTAATLLPSEIIAAEITDIISKIHDIPTIDIQKDSPGDVTAATTIDPASSLISSTNISSNASNDYNTTNGITEVGDTHENFTDLGLCSISDSAIAITESVMISRCIGWNICRGD